MEGAMGEEAECGGGAAAMEAAHGGIPSWCTEKMIEVTKCAKILLSRIQKLEPEEVANIITHIFNYHEDEEIIKYANGPDMLIHSLIDEFRSSLLAPKPNNSGPTQPLPNHHLQCMSFSPTIPQLFSPPSIFHVPAPYLVADSASDQQLVVHDLDNQAELLSMREQLQPFNHLGRDLLTNYYYMEAVADEGLATSGMRSVPGVSKFPAKACHNSYNGLCKHDINCRYLHDQTISNSFSLKYDLNVPEMASYDHAFKPGSLEKLEVEIAELLRARGGMPISIAWLPMMYNERYGKTLQAEGYLTESQRHGKTGVNLTKLLARLNRIRVIDRPHGQHSVVLAEHATKYLGYKNERIDSSAHQIYLTFPAESTFTDEDVWEYFEQYGTVRGVRIPHQEKRMFGFVSFLSPETVKDILESGHPHYIRGARVLVKPYKEKSRVTDMNYTEKIELPMYLPSQYFEVDADLNSLPVCEKITPLEKKVIQGYEQAFERERRRLLELQLTPKRLTAHPNFGFSIDELKVPEDHISSLSLLKNLSKFDEATSHTSSSSDQNWKYTKKVELPMYHPSQNFEVDPDTNSLPILCENTILLEKNLIQYQKQDLEREGRRLFDMQLAPKLLTPQHNSDSKIDDLKGPDDYFSSLPRLKIFSKFDEKASLTRNSSSAQDSGHIQLPGGRFESP